MARPSYIQSFGAFLPGEPVPNEGMEAILGMVLGKPSRARSRVLKQNGIQTRHYALDAQGRPTLKNYEMASRAATLALSRAGADKADYVASATSLPDLFLPGFASMVHGELKLPPCEIASFHGVCASSMAALSAASAQIAAGFKDSALVSASEAPGRHFLAGKYEAQDAVKEKGSLDFDAEFLRWMLSDGAGAAFLSSKPASKGLSLKLDWLDLRSYADRLDTCMYAGGQKNGAGMKLLWGEFADYTQALASGALSIRQDFHILDNIVKLGVQRYLELINEGKVKPGGFDHFVCHYSSHHFKGMIKEFLEKSQASIPEEKWFSNLYTKGNTGSASILIMLEELFYSGKLRPGQKVLCMVPESGRFTVSFAQFEVVEAGGAHPVVEAQPEAKPGESPLKGELLRKLGAVWLDFEGRLNQVPFVKKIRDKTLTIEDYRAFLLNFRQQVVEGSRWITRAASNLSGEGLEVRTLFIQHAKDEHMDYRMLEENFVACGGSREEILAGRKNLGSEALVAWMFQRASEPNPFDLLGSMFIIEGLGERVASGYAREIKEQLGLEEKQVSFILYHGENDPAHLDRLDKAFGMIPLTPELVERMVKTAKVTARLYLLQLEELGNF